MQIFLRKSIKIFLLVAFSIKISTTIVRAQDEDPIMSEEDVDAYIKDLKSFSPEYLSQSNFKIPKIRKHLQILFIDDVLLNWIQKHKKMPTRNNFKTDGYTELNTSLHKLVGYPNYGYLGLFDSFKELKAMVLQRIKDLNVEDEYSFLFDVRANDDLVVNRKDLESAEKRYKIQIHVIDNYILPWIDKNGRFPIITDFNRKPTGISIVPRTMFTAYNATSEKQTIGIFDSIFNLRNVFYSRIKELGLEDKYFYISTSNTKTDTDTPDTDKNRKKISKNRLYVQQLLAYADLHDPQIRTHLQKTFILERVIPWILENQRFPHYIDLKAEGNYIGEVYQKIFRPTKRNPALFASLDEFRKLTFVVIHEEQLIRTYPILATISLSKDLPEKRLRPSTYQSPTERSRLQKMFILEYVLPWIERHQRMPKSTDFGLEIDKIGVPYDHVFPDKNNEHPIFDGIHDLRKKIFSAFKELNLKDLKVSILEQITDPKTLTSTELEDPIIRRILQRIYIRKYIIPWLVQHNGDFPTEKDFGTEPGKVGVLYSEIFGKKVSETLTIQGLFNSILELKEKTHKILQQDESKHSRYSLLHYGIIEPGTRTLDYPISPRDLRIHKRKRVLQKVFIKEYVLPWIHRHKGTLPTEKDFGTDPDNIGLSYQAVFGETLEDDTEIPGIFNSMNEVKTELLKCVSLFIKNMEE